MRTILTPMHFGFHVWGCVKICYPSRKLARKAANLMHGDHLSPYRCPKNPTHFHLGHLAPAIMEGKTTRKNLYTPGDDAESPDQGTL